MRAAKAIHAAGFCPEHSTQLSRSVSCAGNKKRIVTEIGCVMNLWRDQAQTAQNGRNQLLVKLKEFRGNCLR